MASIDVGGYTISTDDGGSVKQNNNNSSPFDPFGWGHTADNIFNQSNRSLRDIGKSLPGQGGIDSFIDASIQFMSGGLLGYNGDKQQLGSGFMTNAVNEGIGHINGSNALRKAQSDAKAAIDEERAARAAELKLQQQQIQNNDIQASNTAAAYRASGQAKQNSSLGSAGSASYSVGKDFMGLS